MYGFSVGGVLESIYYTPFTLYYKYTLLILWIEKNTA
jgi:hypothetical protein